MTDVTEDTGVMPVAPQAAEAAVKPRLRGVFHEVAFFVSLVTGVALVSAAPTLGSALVVGVYALSITLLFGVSAVFHRHTFGPVGRRRMRRVDHSTIFVFIAATYTPVALLVLHGSLQWIVLASAWAGALAGVVFSLAWIDAPRWLVAGTYLAMGWIAVIALPQLLDRTGVAPVVLLAVGGLLYTAGAIIYGARRPNPWPRVFGFHELFHALVIAAATAHFVAIAGWVVLPAHGG